MKHLITAVSNVGRRIARFARQIWDDHRALLNDNPVYRQRLEVGALALLAACSLHPHAALLASVALSLYVGAHEQGSSPWRPGFGGPGIRRPGDDWDV